MLFRFTMKNVLLVLVLVLASGVALAEGSCPPGSYPIGGQGVQGCAPIPGGGSGAAGDTRGPVATGKWETRWGAVADDSSAEVNGNVPTGAAVSQKSQKAASSLALSRCAELGGRKCKVKLTYFNQCIAMADPVGDRLPGAITVASRAKTVDLAKGNALQECRGARGQQCDIVYSACSMSEFKAFK